MTIPSAATKVHLDSGTDDPKQARSELEALVDKFNTLRSHLGTSGITSGSSVLGIGTGLESAAGSLRVKGDGSTIEVSAGGIALKDTAVTPGSYTAADITIDQQGRITAAASGSSGTFTSYYESAAQTITAGGTLTLTHGLGAEPKGVQLVLECTSNDVGYSTGEKIFVAVATGFGLQSPTQGSSVGVKFTSTQIILRFGSAPTATFGYVNGTDGQDITLQNSRWQLYVRAWA